MRSQVRNLFNETHGRPMRAYDFFAAPGKDFDAIVTELETELGVKLRGITGEQHGYVNTGTLPDGTVYVAVMLHDVECTDPNCPTGHGSIAIRAAPTIPPGKLIAAKARVGEHPTHKMGRGKSLDNDTLDALGLGRLKEP